VVEATLASALLPSSHDETLERERRDVTLSLSEASPAEDAAVGGLPNLMVSAGASRSSSSFFLMAARTSCGVVRAGREGQSKGGECKCSKREGNNHLLLFVELSFFHCFFIAPLPCKSVTLWRRCQATHTSSCPAHSIFNIPASAALASAKGSTRSGDKMRDRRRCW
jgi:hypothetical protein